MKDRMIFILIAIDCIERCEKFIGNMVFDDFILDLKTQDAVIRNIEVIGQSLKDFGIDDLVLDYPDIRWKSLAGMRNIIAHEYSGIDLTIIWGTLIDHLIPLKQS